MRSRVENKQCVNLNVHEAHLWGEGLYGETWACDGLDEADAEERVRDLDKLAADYEELASRVRTRQITALKKHFFAAYQHEGTFEEWWADLVAREPWNNESGDFL